MTIPPRSEPKLDRTLLVVDDRPEVLRAIERYVRLHFRDVWSAQTPDEAERLLITHKPDFLLCDFWLGESHPPATALIPRWRSQCPSLRRVVLMSGTKSSSIPPCPEIDASFAKPLQMSDIIAYFARVP
jgi:DNA-binding NtrC family response regulator